MRTMRARAVLLCIFAAGAASEAHTQGSELRGLSGFWQPKFDREPFGQVLIDQLPDEAVFIDDAGAGELAPGDFAGLKLTPRAVAEIENYDPAAERRPERACVAPSVAFIMQAPFPMEIYEGRDFIVMKLEYYDLVRIVFLDGREHPPADVPPSKSGHSIGYWEGDTLVVDTTHVAAATFMNNGFDHSDNIHILERFRLSPDATTLWITQVYTDPETFEGLASRYMAFTRAPGQYVYPFECDPGYLVQ